MKLMKRANLYKASNVTFNPETFEAFSYVWWKFVAKVEGKVVFNNYRYSPTTGKHQYKVRRLLEQLGIKIDIEIPLPRGINSTKLAELYVTAEEYLCEAFLNEELKREERNLVSRHKRNAKKLEEYLETQVHFRDYEIKQARQFGHINKVAVHQVVEPKSLERDVENALHNFHRDGFGSVVFYV